MERKTATFDIRNEQIKLGLKAKGILLSDVAKKLNVTPGLVSGALLGRFRSARVEIAVAKLLGTTPEELWPDRIHKKGHSQ